MSAGRFSFMIKPVNCYFVESKEDYTVVVVVQNFIEVEIKSNILIAGYFIAPYPQNPYSSECLYSDHNSVSSYSSYLSLRSFIFAAYSNASKSHFLN